MSVDSPVSPQVPRAPGGTARGSVFDGRNSAPWFVLVAGLGLSLLGAWGLMEQSQSAGKKQFELEAGVIADDIEARMRRQQQILLGGAGLFDANGGSVGRAQWRTYVERLNLKQNYPGILGVGFSRVIQPEGLKAHVAAVRAEGFPEYAVKPPGERPLYTAIVYLEPFAGRNLAAFGFDMFSEPTRRQAMSLAMESGRTVITAKVKLVQENQGKVQAGFLMYVPVYRQGMPTDTPEARRKAVYGFVYSPYRIGDLMQGILGEANDVLDFSIHDGTEPGADSLMYASEDERRVTLPGAKRFSYRKRIDFYGHSWTASFHSRHSFEKQFDNSLSWAVLALGGGISAALFALTASLTGRREKALALAKEMSAQFRESEQRIQAVLDNIVDGIITIDGKGVVDSFNQSAERIFGYETGEVIGRNVRMLMPEPYAAEHDGYLRSYLTTGVRKIIGIGREVAGRRKDGTVFPMELAVSEMEVNGERVFTGIVRDITERKRAERMKSEFVSTVSHELRTPLTSIRGSLGLIAGGVLGEVPEQVRGMLTIASNNTERLLMLINDILDMQKVEAGKMVFRFENIDLMGLLDHAVADMSTYAEQHRVRYSISQRVSDAYVFADRARMMQVLANLMSNAAKFSPPDSQVEIAVARQGGGRLRISVTDVGPGIPEDFKPRIFSPFTQSDSSDTRAKGGTGLGLAITKAIVERHGGQINFVSRLGVGTTFYVDLPEMVADGQAGQPRVLAAAGGACVLIVEDDPDIAALLQRMLTEAGMNADVAYTAAQARQLLARNGGRYRLMTLDLKLPDENGMSLLESLRNDAANRELPVVVVSVQADEAKGRLSGGAMGVMDWLQKPIDPARLFAAVAAIQAGAGDRPRILHVEDEADVRAIVAAMLQGRCEITSADSVAAAREALAAGTFDLVLLDIGLPDGSGLDLIDLIEKRVTSARIVILSANDVADNYADRVSAVLVKSQTGNADLLRVLLQNMRKD